MRPNFIATECGLKVVADLASFRKLALLTMQS
jgi:hypothetical protein